MANNPAAEKFAAVISLGCDKNRVDSERLSYYLTEAGYTLTADVSRAEVAVVNTCAFITAARRESVDAILRTAEYKKTGALRRLIVGGCLTPGNADELKKSLPEVDAFIGTANYSGIGGVIEKIASGGRVVDLSDKDDFDDANRTVSTPRHYAYLRIAEGCSNTCTYCAIPSIRGKYRSRDFRSLIDEARNLADGGVKELLLIAQDTAKYYSDIDRSSGASGLLRLTDALGKIDGVEWLRLLYLYPDDVSDNLLRAIADSGKVVKYADIPLQHASDKILKLMGRRTDGGAARRLMERARTIVPGISVRSSFIVGFPGETDADFSELLDFLREFRLDNAGFFGYSREAGTAAAKLGGQIPRGVIRERLNAAGKLQKAIIEDKHKSLVNSTVRVLIDGTDTDTGKLVGRTEADAPEIDTRVILSGCGAAGEFADVLITGARNYDTYGTIITDKKGERR